MVLRLNSAEDTGICRRHRHESDLPRLHSRATLLNPTEVTPAQPFCSPHRMANRMRISL
jgi:hypothetical protein